MTNVTTDIEHWYGMNEPEDQQDKDDLVNSVETRATVGHYTTQQRHGQLFVTGWSSDELRLSSQKAVASFLRYVRQSKALDGIDLDFERATKDPKA